MKTFTDKVGETGIWNGEAIEGFVVRTHLVEYPSGENTRDATPYNPGSALFFKVKFDEPYMMYRDWREITKKLLSTKDPIDYVSMPKNKMKRPETKVYVKWIKAEIKRDKEQFEGYLENKGIIATRLRFLDWLVSEGGGKGIETEEEEEETKNVKTFGKTIIVPVAIPGCGLFSFFPSHGILLWNLIYDYYNR